MGKSKRLCKWDKGDLKDNLKDFKKIVAKPRFFCTKCGRVAKDEDFLCKPDEL